MAEKVKVRDTVNPFAHIEAAKPKDEEKKKKPAKKKSGYMDMPFNALKYVGDYFRGVSE